MWTGVPMFFVISGYCISASADSARRKSQGAKTYFMRRFRRIYPPYWIALVIVTMFFLVVDKTLFPGLVSSPPPISINIADWLSPSQWIGNITLTETWRHYLFGDARGHFVGQSWTLCYEEQFYALTGLILFATPRLYFHAALLISCAVLLIQWIGHGTATSFTGFFFDGQWLLFALGILVYYRVNYANSLQLLVINSLLVAMIVGCRFLPFFDRYTMFAGLCFAAFISFAHRWDNRLSQSQILRPLAACGTMCYSLYLVHGIIARSISKAFYVNGLDSDVTVLVVVVPLSVAASLLAGWIFYVTVERRFLNAPLFLSGPPVANPPRKVSET
jgi:peptidoglycan/LPS O-acetylase OafA/YrhL